MWDLKVLEDKADFLDHRVNREFREAEDYLENQDHRVPQVPLVCLDPQEKSVQMVLPAETVTQEYVVHQEIRDLLDRQVCQES